jgi:hypothetical protein
MEQIKEKVKEWERLQFKIFELEQELEEEKKKANILKNK